nr:PREDICTED: uncharacterized protein LOC108223005 isoform X2 [Daucus carota subsp. sativus]
MDLPRNLLKIFYTPFSTTFYFIVIRKIYLGGYDEMVKHLCMSMAASFIQMSFVLLLLTLVLGAAYLPHFTALHSQSSASPVDYANYHARRLCNHHEYAYLPQLTALHSESSASAIYDDDYHGYSHHQARRSEPRPAHGASIND